jgi:hypothetical protein
MASRALVRFAAEIGGLGSLLATVASSAGTVTLEPVADTSIYSAFPTFNFGGGTTITAGGRPHGGESRGLMLFNLQSALPPGAVIQSVSLRLTVLGTPPNGAVNSVFDLNMLGASWAEGTGSDRGGSVAGANEATWNKRFGTSGSPWATPGGDFSSSVSAFVSILADGNYTIASTPALVSNVQGWLNNPGSNFGWLLRSESESIGGTIRRFGSHENPAASPELSIQYSTVPEPSAAWLIVAGFGAWAWARRK